MLFEPGVDQHFVENYFSDCIEDIFHQTGVCGGSFKVVDLSIFISILPQIFVLQKVSVTTNVNYQCPIK